MRWDVAECQSGHVEHKCREIDLKLVSRSADRGDKINPTALSMHEACTDKF